MRRRSDDGRGGRWRGGWVDLLGTTAAELIGGRFAIGIRAAIGVWRMRGVAKADEEIGAELERSAEAGEAPDANRVAGPLELSEEDAAAVDFGLALVQMWRRDGDHDLEAFVKRSAGRVWTNAAVYRKSLANAALDSGEIKLLCRDAGVDLARVSLQGSAEQQWFSVLEYLRLQPSGLVLFLLYLAAKRAPAETALLAWEPA
jgi:hypothetical protein